jgi:hypothetical protein
VERYAKVFINAELERGELLAVLQGYFPGSRLDRNAVVTPAAHLDLYRNKDHDPAQPRDFIHFRYAVELYPAGPDDEAAFRAVLAHLLTRLWAAGLLAVAVSDFDDALPHHGGYRSGQLYLPPAHPASGER